MSKYQNSNNRNLINNYDICTYFTITNFFVCWLIQSFATEYISFKKGSSYHWYLIVFMDNIVMSLLLKLASVNLWRTWVRITNLQVTSPLLLKFRFYRCWNCRLYLFIQPAPCTTSTSTNLPQSRYFVVASGVDICIWQVWMPFEPKY